ncbi:MAG TPA: trypsin-like peptidase domain-containing protein [Candidatus Sulfotelmatobacter sp.]|nr:trypsin-like peptidase domain-containing protein [Candidatus Sulfotelmatobacter sp.]
MNGVRLCMLGLSVSCAVTVAGAVQKGTQTSPKAPVTTSLEQLSTSLQAVARQVEPAVVQIFNSSYAVEAEGMAGGTVVSQQRSSGSGLLISAEGYIVTNAHVVQGARRLLVRLNKDVPGVPNHLQEAKLVGMDQQTDLAVIKIELNGLPFLKFADSGSLNQGQIVLAFGNPLGLQNSVSMGVISAVDRQLDADSPLVFIQTDAAINPGNSGGPLVNTAGEVVGVNTFIFTKSGGNEGVGFAIPSNVVDSICHQIRVEHHVHHHQVGILVRAITPAIAQALSLPIADGVLIEDVIPDSPAQAVGLKVGDIVVSVHGKPITNVRDLALNLYSYAVGEQAEIAVLRAGEKSVFNVPVLERTTGPQRFEDLVHAEDRPLPRLGILGLTVDAQIAPLLGPVRLPGGVVVAAKMADFHPQPGDELLSGDVIHTLNGATINDVATLRSRIESLRADAPLVLQIERSGTLHFVTLESE